MLLFLILINGQAATRERKLYEAMVAQEESVDIVEFAASRAIESKRGELVQQAADLRLPRRVSEKHPLRDQAHQP